MEFFGCAHYSAHIWMDPERPDEVYCDGTLWNADLDKATTYPFSTIWRANNAVNDFATHGLGMTLFTANNGRQYGYSYDTSYRRVLFIREGDVFKPMLAFSGGGGRIWADANGDSAKQPDEEMNSPNAFKGGFYTVDKDLNMWAMKEQVFRPIRVEAGGRPVYDFTKPEKTPIVRAAMVDPDDNTVYVFDGGEFGSRIDLGRFTPDGKMLWGYSGSLAWWDAINLPPQRPGKMWGATAFLGLAGDFTGFATYFGVHQIYARDGICVGTVLRDPRLGGSLSQDMIASDNINGQLVKPKGRKEPVPGDVRLLLSMCQGAPTVVAYRARVPGAKSPATSTSPVGKYRIDVVEPLKAAKLAFRPDADGKGCSAELAVPLTDLSPLKPAPGLTIGFDAGVNFPDAAGQFNAAKAFWTGREAIVRDIPTEASFFQDKWGTLEFTK